ncbi:unnamed protein product [Phytophthora fragariaefolia]|uniref:Unnamed protein product n=1 Tax=Phytophthora fragariaefolia TaxID=1490495 RepID=A0A9W6YM18_9STRA|nr:unnamed protein product [Phytophthora fragariaefolia]
MVDRPKYDPPTRILKRDPIAPTHALATTTMRPSDGLIPYQAVTEVESNPVEAADIKEVPRPVETNLVDLPENDRMITHHEEESDLGNALPPAAVGVVCDIDVGDATPIAQRVRQAAPQYRDKLSALTQGLLGASIVSTSTSPWASPIVVVIKKNGVDIRLCIDYRLVNSLTRLVVHPIPLIGDLLEDLDKILWYCSLDMTSGFWVVQITERARKTSAFITRFGLFEWTRMPFGLRNAPQTYQQLLDNALYGYLRIRDDQDSKDLADVFESGEPEPKPTPLVLGRRSYIDDI